MPRILPENLSQRITDFEEAVVPSRSFRRGVAYIAITGAVAFGVIDHATDRINEDGIRPAVNEQGEQLEVRLDEEGNRISEDVKGEIADQAENLLGSIATTTIPTEAQE